MCGVSGVELLVIIVAAIIILGPDKLPELMRMGGKLARQARRIRGDLGEVTREIRSTVDVREMGRDLAKDLQVDRVRERVRDAETEIDAIRARLKRPVGLPDASAAVGAGIVASTDAGTGIVAAATSPPASMVSAEVGVEIIEPADAPSIEGGAPADGMPTVRPAGGTVAQGQPTEATPVPPKRVRSTARGTVRTTDPVPDALSADDSPHDGLAAASESGLAGEPGGES